MLYSGSISHVLGFHWCMLLCVSIVVFSTNYTHSVANNSSLNDNEDVETSALGNQVRSLLGQVSMQTRTSSRLSRRASFRDSTTSKPIPKPKLIRSNSMGRMTKKPESSEQVATCDNPEISKRPELLRKPDVLKKPELFRKPELLQKADISKRSDLRQKQVGSKRPEIPKKPVLNQHRDEKINSKESPSHVTHCTEIEDRDLNVDESLSDLAAHQHKSHQYTSLYPEDVQHSYV